MVPRLVLLPVTLVLSLGTRHYTSFVVNEKVHVVLLVANGSLYVPVRGLRWLRLYCWLGLLARTICWRS